MSNFHISLGKNRLLTKKITCACKETTFRRFERLNLSNCMCSNSFQPTTKPTKTFCVANQTYRKSTLEFVHSIPWTLSVHANALACPKLCNTNSYEVLAQCVSPPVKTVPECVLNAANAPRYMRLENLLPQPHIEGFIWSDAFPARTTSMVF